MGTPIETVKAWADAADCSCVSRDAINAQLRRGGPGGRAFQVRPPDVRGLIGGDNPVSITVPVRVVSTPNARTHRQAAARLVRHQRNLVALWLGRVVLPAPPARARLTRVYCTRLRQRPFDDDNAVASLKAVRDAVADLYGCGDGPDSLIEFVYGTQSPGDQAGVLIEIVAKRPKT